VSSFREKRRRHRAHTGALPGLLGILLVLVSPGCVAQSKLYGAPAEATSRVNPFDQQAAAAAQGKVLYEQQCAVCHGTDAAGAGNVPALAHSEVQAAASGEIFWFISKPSDGMPSFASLPEADRWRIVTFLKNLTKVGVGEVGSAPIVASREDAPPPTPPFTDFRFESPGTSHKISASDLPAPYATSSARNSPSLVPRPPGVWPQAPAGFKVGLYAEGLSMPRVIHIAPNADVFLAESGAGQLRVFRGLSADGKPERSEIFATGLNRPYGIAFYPAGPDPRWIYVGDTDQVVRLPYRNGDLQARGPAERLMELPSGGGHWTRDLQFSRDGRTLFIAVGSASNVDDPDTSPREHLRANILAADPNGKHLRVYAAGIRNPSGLAIDPTTGDVWCTVNERDALGDNLVPDYITRVRRDGFYGWPWWYIGAHQDPRHAGKHAELKDKTIVPDVLLQPHNASLQIAFYEGRMFPSEYQGDLFATQHGSWNKSVRAGYEVIRVPLHQADRPSGDYQDFLTGFVLPSGQAWGRPVGVVAAPDGALLVTDDGSSSIWRVTYVGSNEGGAPAETGF
jgi:glucose/arabinose dehydrogenase/mono/diheme cytochrome c family protein